MEGKNVNHSTKHCKLLFDRLCETQIHSGSECTKLPTEIFFWNVGSEKHATFSPRTLLHISDLRLGHGHKHREFDTRFGEEQMGGQ